MRVRALDRKLLRDLWHLRGQVLAIAAVTTVGVAMCVAYLSTFDSLQLTRDSYYRRHRFADVFSQVKRAPQSAARSIQEIPGVGVVETRVVADVTLDIDGLSEPATGRLISMPVPGGPLLNQLFLRRGRMPAVNRPDEVVVNEAFALAHRLDPGARIRAVINGRRRDLRVVGLALSPEYVYTIRPGDIIPDNRRFGIVWMERAALGAAFDMEGGFNDVTVTVAADATVPAVLAGLDRVLAPYGSFGAFHRDDQLSNWSITNELRQLRSFGVAIPLVFLLVAAFLLNIVLTRMVSVQREQIAALKALGYANRDLALHYIRWGLTVAILGSVFGTLAGWWMGSSITSMYNDYFKFPVLEYRLTLPVVLGASGISLVASILGAVGAVRRAVRLPPAEAMRPEPPARYQPSLPERLGAGRLLGPIGRMIARNIERQPVRTTTSVLGIGMAAAMMVLGLFFLDAIDELMRQQFDVVERQDVIVSLVEPRARGTIHALRRLPGVLSVEPVRQMPVRLRAGHRSRQIALIGLPPHAELRRVIDITKGVVDLPESGLVLTATLADSLGVSPGDRVVIEVLEGRRPVKTVPLSGVVDEYLGISAYMSMEAVSRLLLEAETLSGGYLRVDPLVEAALHRELKLTPGVAGVTLKRAALDSFRTTMDETMGVMVFFNVLFASTIAFGVVYSAARVSLSERGRELASLRVLGFTRAEISTVLLGELAVLTLAALPVGLVIGYGLAALMVSLFQTELYRFPLVVSARTHVAAAGVTMLAAVVSGLIVRRRLDTLNLVEVLKSRE